MNTDTARAEFSDFLDQLRVTPRTWLVTGAAGFIGSHLVETLLSVGQTVRGMDNLSTGSMRNVEAARAAGPDRYEFIQGDVRNPDACAEACANVDIVLHQAALGSVPRSISDPAATHASNADGTFNMLLAARDAAVARFVFASSSSVYGDHEGLPKVEGEIGTPLSPYAVSKRMGELYARTFRDHYQLETVGLRYFNVFGPRQDPAGPYAAVIPKWFEAMASGEATRIFGDGRTSRDFCYVANVVQANLRAATAERASGVYNVAVGETTMLNDLHGTIRQLVAQSSPGPPPSEPHHEPFRKGDIKHSLADTTKAQQDFAYAPTHDVADGLLESAAWYLGASGE